METATVTQEEVYTLEDGTQVSRDEWLVAQGLRPAFAICTEGDYKRYLRRRNVLVKEAETIKTQMEAALKRLNADLKQLDWLYFSQAEDWTRRECARIGKSSFITEWGTPKFTTISAGWKLEEKQEKALQEWLGNLTEQRKVELSVKPKEWSRDLDKLKELASAGEVVPGLKYDAEHKKFSIAYSKGG